MKYKVSSQKIKLFVSFGKMPMTNVFLDKTNFRKHPPNIAILCSWNHKNEIIRKEKNFRRKDGKWISHVK